MTKPNQTIEDPDEDVSLDKEVVAKRSSGSAVIAVRLSSQLLREIDAYAKTHELTLSEVVRQGVEQLVGAPLLSATGTRIYSSTVFFGSRTTGGQLRSTEGLDRMPAIELYTISTGG